tara:strand:- start:34626 stop:34727 length:102 start_codon:yes stop_codon:yes gene_type:complete
MLGRAGERAQTVAMQWAAEEKMERDWGAGGENG